MTTAKTPLALPQGYTDWLAQLKAKSPKPGIAQKVNLGSSLLPNCRGSTSSPYFCACSLDSCSCLKTPLIHEAAIA